MNQKFNYGDLVKIACTLGSDMSHFPSNQEAIVIASYNDKYGGDDTENYTLYIKGMEEVSWYMENQIRLIKSGCFDILNKWRKEHKDQMEKMSNLDWIFSHGEEVLESGYGPCIVALAKCLNVDVDDLWGSRGEGFTFASNSIEVLRVAAPFLLKNDKQKWLEYVEKITSV